mgnify:CR=1 FL=1
MIPDLSYRTGPYAAGGTPFSDGYQDYFTLLNERDGGIGGERINLVECETGYNTEKGVECYEATKGDDALVYQPLSTGITYQLIPKATADGIPLHTMGYGRTSAANGAVFRDVFNYPANYWNAASVAVNYLLDENGGDLSGKKLALVSILRAGNGLLDGVLELIPAARVGFVGLYRDPETLQPVQYYFKVPDALEDRLTIVVDPMLATGNSSVAAIDLLKQAGATNIRFLCLLAAPEGVARMKEAHPDVPIVTAALDSHLNDHGYIVPGLGDAGDRGLVEPEIAQITVTRG